MTKDMHGRRSLLSSIGACAAAFALGTRRAGAQVPAASTFEPARHPQDGWLDAIPGKHRVVLDVTSAAGVPEALRFAGNIFNGNAGEYGLEEAEIAMVVILRHSATAFGYANGLWAEHGAALADFTRYSRPDAAGPPTANPFVAPSPNGLDALAERGVQFAVCGAASRAVSRRLAGQGGDAEATFNEMRDSMIPSSRLVAAGVIAVTRAQEYGYGAIHVG